MNGSGCCKIILCLSNQNCRCFFFLAIVAFFFSQIKIGCENQTLIDLPNCFGLGETAVASFTVDLLGKNDHVYSKLFFVYSFDGTF